MMPGAAAEADRAAVAFQLALARLGVSVIGEALALFTKWRPDQSGRLAGEFTKAALKLIAGRSGKARDLALSYYRYARALQSGVTISKPGESGGSTTLTRLRAEFEGKVAEVVPAKEVRAAQVEKLGAKAADARPANRVVRIENTDALVEEIWKRSEGSSKRVERDFKRIVVDEPKRRAESSAGRGRSEEKVEREAEVTGKKFAAAVEKAVLDAGRDTVSQLARRDRRVIGYVRRSLSGTPCGFCAMLISRGLWLYKSKASATGRSEKSASVREGRAMGGERYHPHCRCVAEPVYSTAHYKESDLFKQNRELSDLWASVTRGHRGRAALRVWRRFIDEKYGRSRTAASHAVLTEEADAA